LWLTPWSIRERYRVENQLIAGQLTADVQARVFEEQFPNTILYVQRRHRRGASLAQGFLAT
jgi:lipopolysaccharide export LptBFGC system permease protein LptF